MQAPIAKEKVAPSQQEGDNKNNYNDTVAVGATKGQLPLRVRITIIIMRQLPPHKKVRWKTKKKCK